ncbi:CPBP family intramembrane glutamic endopeptidase [Paenibacillus caui]|uniref:CPBP family intramembrane glutamic endopeptidase n=1 Tax=Paenibacillus caui TaxID=2873927 RepID=UPI001CA8F549|nr:CPBP family intramembrane glutamic endopeptidase [Paenibacillus caui]
MKKSFFDKNNPFLYAASVLLVTWLITGMLFIKPGVGTTYFAVVMFVPAITAIVFNKIRHNGQTGFRSRMNAKALMFGILYPLVFIVCCALFSLAVGRASVNTGYEFDLKAIITLVITIAVNLFNVLGEEYGWRGYLLPELTERFGKLKATAVLGVIWAAYHAPAVYLLAKATGIGHPVLLCLIQACAVFTITFPFSYCYYLSGNIIPVLFLHSVWNVVNTTVLGDIYTNKQGIIEGNLVLINGEGVLGLIFGLLMMLVFIRQFRKQSPVTSHQSLMMRR